MKYYLIALGGACAVTEMPTALLCQGQCATAEDVQYAEMQDVKHFSLAIISLTVQLWI